MDKMGQGAAGAAGTAGSGSLAGGLSGGAAGINPAGMSPGGMSPSGVNPSSMGRPGGMAPSGPLAIRAAMQALSVTADPGRMAAEGNGFIRAFPPAEGLGVASALAYANPFFLPDIPAEFVSRVALGIDGFGEAAMRAKLTASRASQLNILVAGAPASGSDMLAEIIAGALGLPRLTLSAAALDPASVVALGGAEKEEELDELAMIRAGLNAVGYVAGHRLRANPYSCRLMALYGIRPIVVSRAIPETIVAIDEAILARRAEPESPHGRFFDDGMPEAYPRMEPRERLGLVVARHLVWLVQAHVSWAKCARAGLVRPLFLTHEADILGDKGLLAARVADHLALPVEIEDLFANVMSELLPSPAEGLPAGRAEALLGDSLMDEIAFWVRAFEGEDDIACLMPH